MRMVVASTKHVQALLDDIRPEDAAEVEATTSEDMYTLIARHIKKSNESWSVFNDDKLVAILGVASLSLVSGIGTPWALSTNEATKHKRVFMKASRILMDNWLIKYPILICYIDARYKKALRWAKWLGFTIHPPKPYGEKQLPFHKVEVRR